MVRKPSADRRERLLASALKLFVAQGIQNTSTAEIAAEAGCASGTLFLYFPTKQALIDELALDLGKKQSEYIHSLLAPNLSVQETFRIIWDGSLRWLLNNVDAFQYVQQVRNSRMISPEAVQISSQFFDYYYAAIQLGLAQKQIKPYPIELIGGFLYQCIVGMMDFLQNQPDPLKQKEYIQMGFELFWNGIKA